MWYPSFVPGLLFLFSIPSSKCADCGSPAWFWNSLNPTNCGKYEITSYSDSQIWSVIEEGSHAIAYSPKTKGSWMERTLNFFKPPSLKQIFSLDAIKDVINSLNRHVSLFLSALADFAEWVSSFFKTNSQLALEAKQRYDELDTEVTSLVHEYKSLGRMCHHPADNDAWAECNRAMIRSTEKLMEITRERRKARRSYQKLVSAVNSGEW